MTVESRMLIPFSFKHFRCAVLCAEECRKIEATYQIGSSWEENAPIYMDDVAFASGAIISSVAFLESTINELFLNCTFNSENVKELPPEAKQILSNKWKTKEFPEKTMLFKYCQAYGIILKKGIDTDHTSYKNVEDLINLRNILVHFKPKWQMTDPITQDEYEISHLIGRFKENIFMTESGNPFFPSKCLGAGCALWAVRSAEEFYMFFFSSIGIKPNTEIDSLRQTIISKSLSYEVQRPES